MTTSIKVKVYIDMFRYCTVYTKVLYGVHELWRWCQWIVFPLDGAKLVHTLHAKLSLQESEKEYFPKWQTIVSFKMLSLRTASTTILNMCIN